MEIQLTEYELTYLRLVVNDHTYPVFESFEYEHEYYAKLTEDCLAGLYDKVGKGNLFSFT